MFMFKNTLDNKRYYTLNYYYKKKYNSKVFKVSLNAGFTCPNKDEKLGTKGCIFCSKLGSGDFAGEKTKDLVTQFEEVKSIMLKKWPNAKYIGYFQANTNTYAPVDVLKEKFEPILKLDNVVGLNIATRSDAIDDEVLDYLEELNRKTDLTIELGLQSMHDETLKYINRGHDLKSFEDCLKKLKERCIKVVVHIINGLPNETKEMMIETAEHLNNLGIDGIKIHMLHVIKNTELANIYERERFHILTKEEYIDIVINQLERLNENIVINRITGDPVKEDLIEPTWLLKKFCVLNDIDKEMVRRNTYQGIKAK
ncbi:MAG: TIGR01212 family radical SAM protein [Erysipelotrichales bacterium]|nr:TIGR01212 family radical SAM protein [Erysipelotrichales bacterium]